MKPITPFIFCAGFILGALFIRGTDMIEAWGIPVNQYHYFAITEPIQAEVKLEAVATCIDDGEDCIVGG